MAIQVPASPETIERLYAASRAAYEDAHNGWLEPEERATAWHRHVDAELAALYLCAPVSIFRQAPCADCGAPARDLCVGEEGRARRYHSQRTLCNDCQDCTRDAYAD